MAKILAFAPLSPRKSLLSIVGTPHEEPKLGTHVFGRDDFGDSQLEISSASERTKFQTNLNAKSTIRKQEIGLALSGGGARAIAFHLGCLRALNKRDILDRVGVISAVSGGAILAAMYAYSEDDFITFDERVCALLRRGLQKDIVRGIFKPVHWAQIIPTIFIAGIAAKGAHMINKAIFQNLSYSSRMRKCSVRINPPFLRWVSRTTVFESVLRKRLFGDILVSRPCRSGLDVILNATELRTGTAFRFGSRVSSNWRFGTVQEDILVATAVAASAAYPALLPALHKRYSFQKDGKISDKRVVLTDGGIYDNLGASCLDPSRNPDYTTQIYPCEQLICCNAGYGQWDGAVVPYGWVSRMKKAVDATFRKRQDLSMSHFFNQRASGELKGLILPYLGMKDEALQQDTNIDPFPQGFVTRNQVIGYPTDFRAMSETDLDLLSRRGEQLTHLLMKAYW